MPTAFPGGLDNFTNPTPTDALNSGTVPHATQHSDLNDAVEALEAKVGINGSAVQTSLDYRVNGRPRCLLRASGDSSLANNTVVFPPWDIEDIDIGGMHDNVTNNDRVTIPVNGMYHVSLSFRFSTQNTTGQRQIGVFRYNAAGVQQGNELAGAVVQSAAGQVTELSTSAMVMLNATDYLRAFLWQNSTATLFSLALVARLGVVWIGTSS